MAAYTPRISAAGRHRLQLAAVVLEYRARRGLRLFLARPAAGDEMIGTTVEDKICDIPTSSDDKISECETVLWARNGVR